MCGLVSDAADAAGKALGLGGGEAPPRTKASPVLYYLGTRLDGTSEEGGSAVRPVGDNTVDKGPDVEFIHFGRVHPDIGQNFPHNELPDTQRADLNSGGGASAPPEGEVASRISKAIMFRGGVEREAILLNAFLSSSKAVVQEYESNKGGLGQLLGAAGAIGGAVGKAAGGAVAGAVGDLMGGGGGGGPGAELDAILADVSTAGGTANKSPILYKDTHKAGKDLRQYRCDYREAARKLKESYMAPGSSGPLSAIPGIGGAMQQVTSYLFMGFDIYAAMYFAVREKAEPGIARACYTMTLKAIEDRFTRVFPVWFFRWSDDAVEGTRAEESPDNVVEEVVQKINKTIQDIMDKIDEYRRAFQEILGIETGERMAGEDFLTEAFGALGEAPEQVRQAFRVVSGWDSPPPFIEDVMGEIASAAGEMLQIIYRRILLGKGQTPISDAFVVAAGRVFLFEKLVGVAAKLTGGFLDPDKELLDLQGLGIGKVTGKQVTDKAVGLLDAALGDKVEFIVRIAAKDLAAKLEAARADAQKSKSMTMEVFLGRLPWLYTIVFRNTFFPIWDLVVQKVFGTIGGPLGDVASAIKSPFGAAHDAVDDAIGAADDAVMGAIEDAASAVKGAAKDVKDTLGKAGVTATLPDALEDPMKALGLGGEEPGGGEEKPAPFPGSSRLTTGTGQDPLKEQIDEVNNSQKVDAQMQEQEADW